MEASSIAADMGGNVWIVQIEGDNEVMKWDGVSWEGTGLKKAVYVGAGEENQVYAIIADDYTPMYRWTGTKFVPMPGQEAESVAVGINGRLYRTQYPAETASYTDSIELVKRACQVETLVKSDNECTEMNNELKNRVEELQAELKEVQEDATYFRKKFEDEQKISR